MSGSHRLASAERPAVSRLLPTRRVWLALGVVVIAFNLRPALVAVSPVLDDIRASTGLSAAGAGLLTTLPVLCFGVLSTVVPPWARRLGVEWLLTLSMVTLCVASLARLVPGLPLLFIGSILAGGAIAVGNVLVPSIIKRDFANRVGVMMGLYSMTLSGGAALAAGITVPLTLLDGIDWRIALALWGAPAALAAVLWSFLRVPRADQAAITAQPAPAIWRSGLAWWVSAFMGLQSLNYYSTVAWLPAYLSASGFSAVRSGWILSLVNLVSVVSALIAPMVAVRAKQQGKLGVATTALSAAGLLGLILWPGAAAVWAFLLGIGVGGSISLALTLIVLRSHNSRQAAALSGMAQSVGYLIAAAGPVLVGLIHDLTDSWSIPLFVLAAFLLPQAICVWMAGRPRRVETAG